MTWGGVGEIFNPGERHLTDEMERKRVEAKIPGSEGFGDTQVDLEQGVLRLSDPDHPGHA